MINNCDLLMELGLRRGVYRSEKLMMDRFDAFVLNTSFISVEKTAKLIIQYLNDTIII